MLYLILLARVRWHYSLTQRFLFVHLTSLKPVHQLQSPFDLAPNFPVHISADILLHLLMKGMFPTLSVSIVSLHLRLSSDKCSKLMLIRCLLQHKKFPLRKCNILKSSLPCLVLTSPLSNPLDGWHWLFSVFCNKSPKALHLKVTSHSQMNSFQ